MPTSHFDAKSTYKEFSYSDVNFLFKPLKAVSGDLNTSVTYKVHGAMLPSLA